MKLTMEMEKDKSGTTEAVTVRLLVLNDGYEPAVVDRRLLVGPNPVPEQNTGLPYPVSVEPAFPREEQNLISLNPWCFYGRERTFDSLPSGRVTFHAYLLGNKSDGLLPERPGEPASLLLSAEPLIVSIARTP